MKALKDCAFLAEMQSRGFGGLPVQIGFVSGLARQLNCLEYHKSSEFNIALNDVILVFGCESDIANGTYDTAQCEAFFVPAGTGVELYATTLHYAPWHVHECGYCVACVLPRGTNHDAVTCVLKTNEDKFFRGVNKWLLAHAGSAEAGNGAHVGLGDPCHYGLNILYCNKNMLEDANRNNPDVTIDFLDNQAYFYMNTLGTHYVNADFDVGILPIPKYDTAQEEYAHVNWGNNIIVPTGIKNPRMVGQVLEMMAYYSRTHVPEVYYNDVLQLRASDAPDDRDMVELIYNTVVFDPGIAYCGYADGSMGMSCPHFPSRCP